MMKRWLTSFVLLTGILLLAACGGNETSSEEAAGEAGSKVTVEASNWAFDKEEYRAPAGDVTIELASKEGFHGLQIEGTDIKIENNKSKTVSLEPGEYTINCSIPCGTGHEDMTAKLIIE